MTDETKKKLKRLGLSVGVIGGGIGVGKGLSSYVTTRVRSRLDENERRFNEWFRKKPRPAIVDYDTGVATNHELAQTYIDRLKRLGVNIEKTKNIVTVSDPVKGKLQLLTIDIGKPHEELLQPLDQLLGEYGHHANYRGGHGLLPRLVGQIVQRRVKSGLGVAIPLMAGIGIGGKEDVSPAQAALAAGVGGVSLATAAGLPQIENYLAYRSGMKAAKKAGVAVPEAVKGLAKQHALWGSPYILPILGSGAAVAGLGMLGAQAINASKWSPEKKQRARNRLLGLSLFAPAVNAAKGVVTPAIKHRTKIPKSIAVPLTLAGAGLYPLITGKNPLSGVTKYLHRNKEKTAVARLLGW